MSNTWNEAVTVVLHHVPEDEHYEGGYEAVTVMGVPHNVSVTGSHMDSKEMALQQLLEGLAAFGFVGRVLVEDATGLGHPERYEVEAG